MPAAHAHARRLLALLTLASIYLPVLIGPADPCAGQVNDTPEELLACVTLDGVRAHQAALQAIAGDHNGTRLAGTPGYEASVAYVVRTMTAAGYDVALDPFPFAFVPPPELAQTAPLAQRFLASRFGGTGTGDAAAPVTPVDINLAPPRANDSGCQAADFADFPAGHIALIQRGTCPFAVKAQNAVAAGATAVVFFNQGDTPDREGLLFGALEGSSVPIPVVGARFETGVALAQAGTAARVSVEPPRTVTLHNVIADSRSGDPDRVVMAGAHLDSVAAGPGIQDNGSGVAALLEVARQMALVEPRNKVRFVWWAAEEANLAGSTAYVAGLSAAERQRIALYLNFDMLGSPNYGLFILDGDDSDGVGGGPGPAGSAAIEQVFEAYYTMVGQPFRGFDLTGNSDYGPFMDAGIAVGGLFTGNNALKTAGEAALWGGVAGAPYDPCYHRPCDTFDNINLFALDTNSDAVAYSVLHFAMGDVMPGDRPDQ